MKNREAGDPIFVPFDVLGRNQVHIRRGQLTLIAAPPGCGKSAWTHFVVLKGGGSVVNRVLYMSADSDPGTMYVRSAQMLTGWTGEYIENRLREGESGSLDEIVRAGTTHIQVNYASFPTEDDVRDQINAYLEVYGVYPEVIVMDNLKNLDVEGGEGEFGRLEAACEFLHEVARETNAAVITLHHVVGDYEDGAQCIPLSGLRGKISKTPELILTMHRDQNHLYISPVKNRQGKAQPDGRWYLTFESDLSRMHYA